MVAGIPVIDVSSMVTLSGVAVVGVVLFVWVILRG